MTPKDWTHKDFDSVLKALIAKSGVKVKWETGKKSKGATTIGAIFVPRPPAQEETNAYPIDEVKHDA
jgi:hypothetical protein